MEKKLINLKKRVMDNMQKVLEMILVVVLIGLIVLMFTGRTGAFISAGAFSIFVIVANLPTRGKSKAGEVRESKEEKDDRTDSKNNGYRAA